MHEPVPPRDVRLTSSLDVPSIVWPMIIQGGEMDGDFLIPVGANRLMSFMTDALPDLADAQAAAMPGPLKTFLGV